MICLAPKCSNVFIPKTRRRIYCSDRCCARAEYYRNANKPHRMLYRKTYADSIKEKSRIYNKKRRTSDKKRIDALSLKWHRDNPERSRLRGVRRRIQKYKTSPIVRFTQSEWAILKRVWKFRCAYCGKRKPLTQDHATPLSRGGDHTIDNILPACKSCNSSKQDKTWDEYISFQLRGV